MLANALRELEAAATSGRPWLQPYAFCDAANLVDRERLEVALDKVRSRVSDPKRGLFGPSSMVWRLYGCEAANVGILRMLLLQTAHPFVAHAVQQKSAYRTDSLGRNERTLRAIVNWVYGDLERVLSSARTVFRVHSHIHGEIANRVGPYDAGDRYSATEQRSQYWVHATGIYNSWQLYEHVYGPLTREQRERYNEETKLMALIFGIDEALLPPTFDDFLEYWNKMTDGDAIVPDQASCDIARYVLSPPLKELTPVFDWLKIMTAGLLPPHVRHGYQLKWGRFEEVAFAASMKTLRTVFPRLPTELRHTFYYRRAMHQARATKPGAFERKLNRAFVVAVTTPVQGRKTRMEKRPERSAA